MLISNVPGVAHARHAEARGRTDVRALGVLFCEVRGGDQPFTRAGDLPLARGSAGPHAELSRQDGVSFEFRVCTYYAHSCHVAV